MRLCAVDPRAPLRSPAPPPATLAQRRVTVGGTDAPAHMRTHAHPWPSSRHVAAGVLHRLRHELRPVLHRQRFRLHVLRMGRPKVSDSALSGPPSNAHTLIVCSTHPQARAWPPLPMVPADAAAAPFESRPYIVIFAYHARPQLPQPPSLRRKRFVVVVVVVVWAAGPRSA